MIAIVWKVPNLVHVLNDVTSMDGFLQFRGGPGYRRDTVQRRCGRNDAAFGQWFGLFVFHD